MPKNPKKENSGWEGGLVLLAIIIAWVFVSLNPIESPRVGNTVEKKTSIEDRLDALDGGLPRYWVCAGDKGWFYSSYFWEERTGDDGPTLQDILDYDAFLSVKKVETIGKVAPDGYSKDSPKGNTCVEVKESLYDKIDEKHE